MKNVKSLMDFGQVYKSEFNYTQEIIDNFFNKKVKYPFVVGDIEATLEDNVFKFSLGVLFDGRNFHYAYTIEDYFSLAQSLKVRQIFFHNLNFDFIFFLRDCFLGVDVELIQSGNMILRVKSQGVTFLNSLSLFPMSLKKVVKNYLKIEWREWENQKDDIFGLSEEDLLEYCMRDCYLTFLAVYKFKSMVKDKYNVKSYLTIPSLSLKIFNKKYIDKDLKDSIFNVKNRSTFFNNDYYFGGHTEKFVNNVYHFKNLNYYDINSLYPYIMKSTRVNTGGFKMVKPRLEKLLEMLDDDIIFYADVLLCVDSEDTRIFPTREGEANYYRFGYIRVKVSDISFKYLKDIGRLDIIKKVYGLLIPKDSGEHFIFKDFVEDMYKLRKNDTANDVIYKLLLNSLYGKYGQKTELETNIINATERTDYKRFINHNDLNFLYVFDDDVKNNTKAFSRFDIAGRITEGARVLMSRYRREIHQKGKTVVYQDTDSLIGEFDLEEIGLNHIYDNKELGKLKKENDKPLDGIIIAQKIYYLSESHKASKGVKNMNKHDYQRLAIDIVNKKILRGDIKITKWFKKDFKNSLFLYPKSLFYNTRFTQYKTFMKSGFFGIQIVPHYITNLRERIDGEDQKSKTKILKADLKRLRE